MTGPKSRPHSSSSRVRSATNDFSRFHGKRIAVAVALPQSCRIICGSASYEDDPCLGFALRIQLDDSEALGYQQLLISETEWDGEIVPDVANGCDFLFTPSPLWPPG
jgi:hypothetical protein